MMQLMTWIAYRTWSYVKCFIFYLSSWLNKLSVLLFVLSLVIVIHTMCLCDMYHCVLPWPEIDLSGICIGFNVWIGLCTSDCQRRCCCQTLLWQFISVIEICDRENSLLLGRWREHYITRVGFIFEDVNVMWNLLFYWTMLLDFLYSCWRTEQSSRHFLQTFFILVSVDWNILQMLMACHQHSLQML